MRGAADLGDAERGLPRESSLRPLTRRATRATLARKGEGYERSLIFAIVSSTFRAL